MPASVKSVNGLGNVAGLESISLGADANLKAHYKLENLVDRIAAINLTNNGSATFAAGLYDNAVSLNGAGQYLSNTATNPFSISGNIFTLSFWCKLTSFPSSGNVADGCYMWVNGGGFIMRYYNPGSSQQVGFVYNNGVVQNSVGYLDFTPGTTWHHWVGACNGTTMELYIDNVSKGTVNPTFSNQGGSDGFYIGGQGGNFPGLIDDFAVFNRRINSTEVGNIYAATSVSRLKNKDALAYASIKNMNGLA